MRDIFNTPFEISLRVLIILNTTHAEISIDRILTLDFISIYGRDFQVSEYNLHGDNNYKFSEYSSRRKIVISAIKELVLRGYILPHCKKDGFTYSISEAGELFCLSLRDEYADEFTGFVKKANEKFADYSDRELVCYINESAISMFGGA